MYVHMDDHDGWQGGPPEHAHTLHDTSKHLRGVQVVDSRTSYHLGDILLLVRPIIGCADAHNATNTNFVDFVRGSPGFG